jgi:hypothetical protein
MKSKFLKGLKQMTHAGSRIIVREVKAVVKVGARSIDNSSKMMEKALEGKPGEAAKIWAGWVKDAVREGVKETKGNVVDGIDLVHGGITALTGIRKDVTTVARSAGKMIGGKPGGQVVDIVLFASDKDDDDDDDANDDDDADDAR